MAPLLSRLGVGNGGFGFGRSGSATPSAPLEEAFEIFLLAGGGGGAGTPAGYAGGGGGSGGAVYFSEYKINSTRTLSITVGGGGAAGSGGGRAPNGTPSTVTDPTGPYVITADGGGGGNGYSPYQIGASGGSGGGSETPGGDYPGAIGTQGSVSGSPAGSSYILYGQPGGPITPTNYGCSGGGGLGAAGSTPVLGAGGPYPEQYRGAPGGIGITLSQFEGPLIGITPLSPYSGRYGGGGGAGTVGTDPNVYGGNSPSNPLPGNASPYGGGIGGKYNGITGTSGVQYLGGGGGGGCPYQSSPNPATGASGGAGICVFRYPTSLSVTTSASGSIATPPSGLNPGNGYIYHTFTGSGSLTVTV